MCFFCCWTFSRLLSFQHLSLTCNMTIDHFLPNILDVWRSDPSRRCGFAWTDPIDLKLWCFLKSFGLWWIDHMIKDWNWVWMTWCSMVWCYLMRHYQKEIPRLFWFFFGLKIETSKEKTKLTVCQKERNLDWFRKIYLSMIRNSIFQRSIHSIFSSIFLLKPCCNS